MANPKGLTGDDLPVQYVDGWMANKNGVTRARNPNNLQSQFASYELWVEGWTARQYAIRHGGNLDLDDFVPRATL